MVQCSGNNLVRSFLGKSKWIALLWVLVLDVPSGILVTVWVIRLFIPSKILLKKLRISEWKDGNSLRPNILP